MGMTSKSTSDLPRGENVANVFKSGDLERAVKAHCGYLFKSKVGEGAEQPSLKSGETWDKVLAFWVDVVFVIHDVYLPRIWF